MKANKLLLVAALFAGLSTLGMAGPGAEYWTRMSKAEKDRAESKAQAAAPATEKAKEMATCTACAGCSSMKKN